ncbi:MAG: histidine kinase [Coriobacteriales bacterium]|jgi:two-component system sensor histidine kinase LytS|nr:histidine kinase [Coriobacteriales bacterium]
MGTRRFSVVESVLLGVVVLLLLIIATSFVANGQWMTIIICVAGIIAVGYILIRHNVDPDRLRARQSERTLHLAAQTLPLMSQGLNHETAAQVCELLLPVTSANGVMIADREAVLGYVGADREHHPVGAPIGTGAAYAVLRDAKMRVIQDTDEMSFKEDLSLFRAAILVPLVLKDEEVVGILKFYYRSPKRIDETEQAMAFGLAVLLSSQISLAELDYQRELASQMELKALQAQINPHFLFNTINTIASLIRTDPQQARILLREFATFYRRTLEGSLDYITIEQEHLQTLRYLGFEIARFGADRITLTSDIEKGLESIIVPAFIIQPIVENAVGHGMREDRPLHIDVLVRSIEGMLVITVADDGIGIPKDVMSHMLDDEREHMGIALKNVNDRLRSFFGSEARLAVKSELGVGTTVFLTLGPTERLRVETND